MSGDHQLREALGFAASVIKSGEPWTSECDRVIGGALGRSAEKNPHDKLPIGSLDGIESYGWPELDDGIRYFVCILRSQGIETCQSCEGGPGHAYPEPTIEFRGGQAEGPRAVGAALTFGLPVAELRRIWEIRDGEMNGPLWSMTFFSKADAWKIQVEIREAAAVKRMGKDK